MIINNACQTIRRPQEYYRHLLDKEAELDRDLEARKRVEDILVRPEKYRLKDANEAEEFPVTVAAEKVWLTTVSRLSLKPWLRRRRMGLIAPKWQRIFLKDILM